MKLKQVTPMDRYTFDIEDSKDKPAMRTELIQAGESEVVGIADLEGVCVFAYCAADDKEYECNIQCSYNTAVRILQALKPIDLLTFNMEEQ